MPEIDITCTVCPLGCRVTVKSDAEGNIESLSGNECKRGKEYVTSEFSNPVRVLTTTLLTEGSGRPLPVRTDKPVPKGRLKEIMKATAGIRVKPPVRVGQEVVHDVLGGVNLIATGNI
jgi:CxxC motif-containing protein